MSEKNEWKPIDSAPKDELILVGPTKRMGICVAMNHSRDGWVTETCNEWFSIYTPTHWMPLPAAPGSTSSAPGDAQDERQAFEAWAEDNGFVLDCDFFETTGQYYEDNETQLAYDIWRAARASVAAPAAGDALDLLRLRRIAWLIGSIFAHGDFKAETVNERELEKLLRENGTFWDSLAQFDAALAAQVPQQGEA